MKTHKKYKPNKNIIINQVLVNTMIVSLHLRPPTTEDLNGKHTNVAQLVS